jgi:hypothetical protein
VMQLDFIGTIEKTLVDVGFELVHVTLPPEGTKNYDLVSNRRLDRAAGMVIPVIEDIIVQLVLAGAAKGLSREQALKDPKARAAGKAKLEGVTNKGERGRVLCRTCRLEVEAAEYSKSVGKEMYDKAVKEGSIKEGKTGHYYKYPGVELHPDGNWYGRYTKLQAAVKDAGLSAKSKRYDFEAHHLLEENMAAGFKIKESEGWCVGVEHMDHVEFSRDMRGLLSKKKRAVWDIDELYELHAQMYEDKGHPEYAEQLLRFIASKRDHFIKLYEKGDVPTKRYLDEATLKRVLKWLNKLPKVEPLPDD